MCDIGFLYYYYPGSYPSGFTNPDTTELYAALNWKMLQLKYSYSLDDKTFGIPEFARQQLHRSATLNWDVVDKVNDVHRQGHVDRPRRLSELPEQRRLQLHRLEGRRRRFDLYGVTRSDSSAPDTNAKSAFYTNSYGKNMANGQFVAYVQKTF